MRRLPDDDVAAAVEAALGAAEKDGADRNTMFCRRVYAEGLGKFRARIAAHGFTNMRRVLDLGCGYGQWSLALSEANEIVDAVDLSEGRVAFVSGVASRLGTANLHVTRSPAEKLPFPDAAFDGVFCYSTLFLTPWKQTLAEVARVTSPGALVYFNANGFGWYRFLWHSRHNESADYDPRQHMADTFANTLAYERGKGHRPGQDVIIEPADLERQLGEVGFDQIRIGAEGTVFEMTPSADARSFFKGDYDGDRGIFELLARRKA